MRITKITLRLRFGAGDNGFFYLPQSHTYFAHENSMIYHHLLPQKMPHEPSKCTMTCPFVFAPGAHCANTNSISLFIPDLLLKSQTKFLDRPRP